MANPDDSKSVVYLSHEVQKVNAPDGVTGSSNYMKVSVISFYFQIFTLPKVEMKNVIEILHFY